MILTRMILIMMLMRIFLTNAAIMMIIAVQNCNNYDHDNINNDSNNDAIIMIMMTLTIMITVIVFLSRHTIQSFSQIYCTVRNRNSR